MQKQQDINITATQSEVLEGTGRSATGSPLLTVRPQSGLTDPVKVNSEMKEILLDLETIFAHLDKTDLAITRYQRLHQSVIENLSDELKLLSDKVDDLKDKMQRPYGTLAVRELFRDASNIETDSTYYDDNLMVDLDLQQQIIRLPVAAKESALVNPYGSVTGKIKILYQAGSELDQLNNSACGLEKAIDADPNTFWAASLMTDEVFNLKWPEYFDAERGALVVLEIALESLQTINEIVLRPFTTYPLDIVGIVGFNSDSDTEQGFALLEPGKSITDTLVISIKDTPLKRLHLILNQRHYIRKDLVLSKIEQDKQKALISTDSVDTDKYIFKPVIKDICEENPLVGSLMTGPLTDIEELGKEPLDLKALVTKYQYDYGLKGVEINCLNFQPDGMYVSKPMGVGGGIMEVTLEANEDHQTVKNADGRPYVVTSFHYWVGDKGDWTPIVPSNKGSIVNEPLDIQYNHEEHRFEAQLMLPAKIIECVKENGIKLQNNMFRLDPGNPQILIIGSGYYQAGSIYTTDYTPTHGTVVEYKDPGAKYQQTFNGTDDRGQIILEHLPYLDKELYTIVIEENPAWDSSALEAYTTSDGKELAAPINVSIRFADGTFVTQPAKAGELGVRNKTDYATGESKMDTFEQTQSNYQYINDGAILKFNTYIPKDAIITVDYTYCRDTIRLKARLRRTLASSLSYTPVLQDYTLFLSTVR